MKSGRLLAFLMVTALILFFGACIVNVGDDNGGGGGGPGSVSGVDFTPYTTDFAFRVRNNTDKNLVAFKTSLSQTNILGGIPGKANGHGIKKNNTLLNKTEDFPMIFITEEDYIKNRNNLSALNETPFTRIYVYYNLQGDNEIVYDISGRLGGNKIIEIGNPSNSGLNIEIRLGGVYGETIGYAPAGMNVTKLYVTEGDFDLFPVFKRYNSVRNTVETLYPTAAAGAWFKPLGFNSTTNSIYWNAQEAIDKLSSSSSGVAWLAINNQSTAAVRLVKGDEVVRSAGVAYFNSNEIKNFTIEMPQAGKSFATTLQIGNLKVGPSTREVNITDSTGKTTFTLKSDYMYVVNVTGDHNDLSLKAVIVLDEESEGGPTYIDPKDFNKDLE
jgi:hypothetical protein